jgi:hypothetical protein
MTENDIMGHWYKCEMCDKIIPIPDYIFKNQDDKILVVREDSCPSCNKTQSFQLSNANKPCTKKEALLCFKKEKQKRENLIRFEFFWEPEAYD